MAETERLIVDLEARVDKFEKGLAKAAADLDKVAQSAGRAEKAATEGGRKTSSAFREAAAGASAFQKAAHAAEQSNAAIARSAGLARHEMINLSRQVQDIGVSLASGQSPFTVLVQQGTQVADIFGSTQGTMRGFAQQLGAIFTPMRLLVGGIVGVTAALAAGVIHVVNYARSMDDLAKMTGFAREELQALEKAGAIKGIASDDVMAGVKAFAAQIEQAQRGTNDLKELFRLNGKEIGTASENMRTLQELVRGAGDDMALIKEILRAAGIEPTMKWIRLLRDANGDIERIKTSLADVKISDEMIETSRRWSEGWASMWDWVKTAASSVLVLITRGVDRVIKSLDAMLALVSKARALVPWAFGGDGAGAGASGAGDSFSDRFGGSSTGDVKALEAYADALRKKMELQAQSNAQTVKSLELVREEARLASLRVSILGEAATAADKEAAARARIEAARRQGVEISKTEEAAIIANATASKVSTKAAQDTSSALDRLRQSREASIGLLQLEIANMFKSAEAARAAEIAYKELNRYKRAGVTITPEIKAEIEANAKLAAAYEKQIDDLKIVKKSIEDMKSTGVDFAKTFVSGLLEGKSAIDALAESAVNVGKKLRDAGLEQALLSLASGDLAGGIVGGTKVLNWPINDNEKTHKDKDDSDQRRRAA